MLLLTWVISATALCEESQFIRGDLVELVRPGIADAVRILAHLFAPESRPPLRCLDAADVNDDGRIDVSDPIHLLHHLFLGGEAPASPYPGCGWDKTPDDLGCEDHEACRPSTQPAQLYGRELDADGVFFVIERSQFMWGNGELAVAKRELIRWMGETPWKTRFGIVFVDAGVVQFPTSEEPATLDDRSSVTAAIELTYALPSGEGACLFEGLAVALGWAAQSGVKRNEIVYIGAGAADCSPEPEEEYLARALRQVQELNQGRARIETIGVLVSSDSSDAFLRDLAEQNGGSYLRVDR